MCKTQLARRIHGSDHRLVRRLAVGADDHREGSITCGSLVQGGHQRVQIVLHQYLAVERVVGVDISHDFKLLDLARFRPCTAGSFAQVHPAPGFAGKGSGAHEEQQQNEYHVDQRREAYVDIFPAPAPKLHALPSPRSTSRSPCTTSTSLMASCSIPTTSSSTRRSRKRWKNNAGMPTIRPAAVVMSAFEIPEASNGALAIPAPMNALKISIIPSTVPRRPSNGAMPAMVPSALR